ncbi:mannitol dehydrogenase family protein [Bauldia sp.]|uniref:mannitol dehydrogenase family protein n=1 Tax=Bauldia sp. TaxID=2575872 RepID=UPI003BABEAAB
MTDRLSNRTLGGLPEAVRVPTYDRDRVRPGIVHLGVGAFHRAHQAVYVDNILADDPSWGIVGASLRRPDTRDALAPQDDLYTVVARDQNGDQCRVIGSMTRVLQADEDRAGLMTALTAADTRIVSLTVTEKGYCHDPATGTLLPDHPDIVHDLANPEAPKSAPGLLVAALAERRRLGRAPFTVLSCDNLPANGSTARGVVIGLAHLMDPPLADWIEAQVAFPATMIDRIVPATTDADRETVAAAIGVTDAWPVVTEPFSQWVIEDRFANGRPRFEDAGVQMVADVAPFEEMKLRMLNGSHSTLAYLGYLAGFETVSAAIGDPALRALVKRLMTDEVTPTLSVSGIDLPGYRDALIARFDNPALKHRTYQIAMDGSQKLPQRLLGTIRDRLAAGASFTCLALGVAGWMRYVTGVDESGARIDVQDPLAPRLRSIHEAVGDDPPALARAYLAVEEVFGTDLAANAEFTSMIERHLSSLYRHGVKATVQSLVA